MSTNIRPLAFNKSDWSGQLAIIRVHEFDGAYEWKQGGSRVQMRAPDREGDLECYPITVDGQETDFRVYKWAGEDHWEATDYFGDFSRTGYHPVEAAAKLLYNLM